MHVDRRTHQNFVVNGLLEIVLGISLLLIAFAVFLSSSYTNVFSPLFFLPVFFVLPYLSRRMVSSEKRSYPQTDYTKPNQPQHVMRHVLLALIFFLIPSLFIFLQPAPSAARGFTLLMGGLFAAVLLWAGFGLVRFTFLAIASTLLSLGLTWLRIEPPMSYMVFCSAFGVILLTFGTVMFVQYTRRET